jgi:serine/threonine protein kinase
LTAIHHKDALSNQYIGKYRLLRLLEQGEFSEIYLAEDSEQHIPVAVKLLHERLIGDDLAKFFVQARLISRLRHPHIVSLLDFGMDGDRGYLIMDYAPNGTLRQRYPKGSILPPATVLHYIQQAADALTYIHDNKLIHCDIKPHNMLLGEHDELLINDFGIAVVSHSLDPLYPEQHDFEGTVIYAAPEQLQGMPRRSSDQYALAVVAYEWFCGDKPFSGNFQEIVHQHLFVTPPPLREKNPALSPAIEQVIMKALSKKVEARFASVQDFAETLEWAVQPDEKQDEEKQPPAPSQPRRQFLSPLPFTSKPFNDKF